MTTRTLNSPAQRQAYSAAFQGWVWGYPLIESLRTCYEGFTDAAGPADGRPHINTFNHATRPSTHEDRWVVTPANDLIYSTSWLNLADGPVILGTPTPTGRYFVMALLDAHTNNWTNIGPRECGDGPARHAIVGPDWQGELPEGVREVRAPTDLVWVIGRILVDDADDLSAAQAFQQSFTLEPLSGKPGRLPASVRDYDASGDPLAFYANLARGLADFPVAEAERGLVAQLAPIGIRPGAPFDAQALEPEVREAVAWAVEDARDFIHSITRSKRARSWGLSYRIGVYGFEYVTRAATAMKGLGALVGSEALYAMSDFDGDKRPLHGSNAYVLHFPAGQLPPVDAFWSVTLYGDDFYLIDNPIKRYALGDRTKGLEYNSDGSLTLYLQHEEPRQGRSNWLPAPAGAFYLVLRLYHPRQEILDRSYRIPAVTRVQ
ncbi:DUF1254 domain-containing protein [Verticiella sediminum]|uniref:DUF1254 domain-containing protein n=1 Tax=Verticiella sediminum TaxID=1247510 RepID=A0A556A7G3_9BURK|nr:DUF1254 domain-containing protein [Verticiella sediminum]TSH88837.1 DUF1254 domain-containing protein [Verticiella sediminum]